MRHAHVMLQRALLDQGDARAPQQRVARWPRLVLDQEEEPQLSEVEKNRRRGPSLASHGLEGSSASLIQGGAEKNLATAGHSRLR